MVDEDTIKLALERPNDFGYSGDLDLFNTWGLCGPSVHRDSDMLQVSNFETIKSDMEERFPDDVEVVSSGHWAVGWIEQLAVRVIDNYEEPTEAFKAILEWKYALEEYPVADEMDYSRREHEDCIEAIQDYSLGFTIMQGNIELEIKDDLPENWADQVFTYLFDTYSICNRDELNDEVMEDAYIRLNFVHQVHWIE